MKLTIVRHGQSEWNKKNLFTGFKDIELTEEGIMEAKECKSQMDSEKYDIAFTSKLKRAYNTCEIIKEELKQDFPIIYNSSLNERDYGDLTGKNKKEMVEIYSEKQVHLWRRSIDVRPPNGENLLDVIDRVKDFYINEIKPELDLKKNVLIVAHGNSIRALLVILGIFKLDQIPNFEIPTGKPINIIYPTSDYYFSNDYKLHGRQILDSRGNPTIEVDLLYNNKLISRNSAPSGASTGSNEALELRDKDKSCFMGISVNQAINKIDQLNNNMYLDIKTLKDLKKCDNQLMLIDGTELKTNLGGNTTTAVSFTLADSAAKLSNMELFEYLSNIYEYDKPTKTPIPMVNILNGGKHAGGKLKIQEFMIMPSENVSFTKRVEHVFVVYNNLKQ